MNAKTVGFIGGGRVTRILLGGFKKAGISFEKIVVSDSNDDVLKKLQKEFPKIVLSAGNSLPAEQGIVFVSLHPPVMGAALNEIKAYLRPESLVISLAPKFTLAKIVENLGGFGRIVRMIPNAPTIAADGYNPVFFSKAVPAADKNELLALFSRIGKTPQVEEEKLETYALITAMGPAYLWFQLYQLQELAGSFGLTEQEAQQGISAMARGAVKTMCESGLPAIEVMNLVASKPLKDDEETIKNMYKNKLEAFYKKLKS